MESEAKEKTQDHALEETQCLFSVPCRISLRSNQTPWLESSLGIWDYY